MDILAGHISVVCGGDAVKTSSVNGWIARLLQYPSKKPEKALAFVTGTGTGTGMLVKLIAQLIGQERVLHTSSINEVFSAGIEDATVVHISEFNWQDMGTVKTLISDANIMIKKPRRNAYEIPSNHHVIITTNIAPPHDDCRRIFVVEGGTRQSAEYFRDLASAMDDPQAIEYFRAQLMARPVVA